MTVCAFRLLILLSYLFGTAWAFSSSSAATRQRWSIAPKQPQRSVAATPTRLYETHSQEEIELEEARLRILTARRQQIRQVLKSAEGVRTLRLAKGWVPELDETTGKPVSSDGKVALSVTAFVLAAGAIALRVGGRAALVSAVGLEFLTDSPELQQNLETVLTTAETMDPATKALLFAAAWTAVKVTCFDAGGVALALAAGILFGGVIQGALASAAAATLGSCAAYALAKQETPFREKALQLLDDYPSLRGIEKVVARDGLKAVLTLRLAPVLPIPIGLYNYVYGVTNVPIGQFAGGIFLGSLKPYLLDSYLGYFGKEVIQGNAAGDGFQDFLLLGALGVSVLIGVFASQLAAETWDSVLEEVEAEKKAKEGDGDNDEEEDDGIIRTFLGLEVPQVLVGFQLALQEADERISNFILEEYEAQVWNYTSDKDGPPPADRDPAKRPNSPELTQTYQGVDLGAATCDGLVLSPLLFGAFLKYADPLYDPSSSDNETLLFGGSSLSVGATADEDGSTQQELLRKLDTAKGEARKRIEELDERIRQGSE